jgi:hypothetical protein
MHFYATTAQIAAQFSVDHEIVTETLESLPVTQEFAEAHIAVFDLPVPNAGENAVQQTVKFAQVTEPGYNAIVFNLPINTNEIAKWREQFYANKAPVSPATSEKAVSTAKPRQQSGVDESLRSRAEEDIANGKWDERIKAGDSYAEMHRRMMTEMNGDPGYQNIRAYLIRRKAKLGL